MFPEKGNKPLTKFFLYKAIIRIWFCVCACNSTCEYTYEHESGPAGKIDVSALIAGTAP